MPKASKFDFVAEKGSYVGNYALTGGPAPLRRFTWQWRLKERTSKSGAARGGGETPYASASPPISGSNSYIRRLNAALVVCNDVLGF